MPNIKSAAKRARTSEKNRLRNRAAKSEIMSVRQALTDALEGADKAKADEAFRKFASTLDNCVKRGIIPANTASRKKARGAAALQRRFAAA